MHNWQWRTWNGCDYLTCSLLDAWPHGFFTRQFRQFPHDLSPILAQDTQTVRVKQVHSDRILTAQAVYAHVDNGYAIAPVNPEAEASPYPQADGIVSDDGHQAVWVCTADCTPVLIADQRTGQVAAVHAGWRGTAAKIVPVAIAQLQAQGSQLTDLRVAMGPAIAGEVYQVTRAVAAQVGASVAPESTPDHLPEVLTAGPQPAILTDPKPGHARLDVRRMNALQLEQMGIAAEQVAIAPHCTYQEPDQFFSYRRDNSKKVQWSGIVSQTTT